MRDSLVVAGVAVTLDNRTLLDELSKMASRGLHVESYITNKPKRTEHISVYKIKLVTVAQSSLLTPRCSGSHSFNTYALDLWGGERVVLSL